VLSILQGGGRSLHYKDIVSMGFMPRLQWDIGLFEAIASCLQWLGPGGWVYVRPQLHKYYDKI